MKKQDLYQFMRGLKMANFQHPRVTYAVNKNKRLIGDIIKDMEENNTTPSEGMKKFTTEREELAKKHCIKDVKGKPNLKTIPNPEDPMAPQIIYDIPGQDDPKSKYGKDVAKLNDKFEKEVAEHTEKIRKYNEEFLVDASEYEPFMLELEILEAHEKCPQTVMDLIHWMIKEPK